MASLSEPGEGLLLRLIAVAIILALRLIALDADPPPWLSWSTGLYTDEGFYTLDARHLALFGRWAPGNFHDRLLSPLLSLLQQGVFTVFGPGLLPARLLAVAFGLLTLGVFWLGLRRLRGTQIADWGTLFLGLAPPFVFYNRLALQETPTVFWLVVALTLWGYGSNRPLLSMLSGIAVGIAFLFKPFALIALPAFAWAWWRGTASDSTPRHGGRWDTLAAPALGLGAVLFLYLVLWYAPHHAELAQMGTYYRLHQFQPHSWRSVWLNIRRGLIGGERGVVPSLLAWLPVPCLLAGWGIRRKTRGGVTLLMLWLLCGIAFCLLSSYAPSRYYVLFLPALAGLAAWEMTSLSRRTQAVWAALFLATSGIWYAKAWAGRTYARRAASQTLARALPPGSIVVGDMAPTLCLDTPFAAAPIQPGLSNDFQPLERLRATAVVTICSPSGAAWWQARYPGLLAPSHRVATFAIGGLRRYMTEVYRVGSP